MKYISAKLKNKLLCQYKNTFDLPPACADLKGYVGHCAVFCRKHVWCSWNTVGAGAGGALILGISCFHLLMLLLWFSVESKNAARGLDFCLLTFIITL